MLKMNYSGTHCLSPLFRAFLPLLLCAGVAAHGQTDYQLLHSCVNPTGIQPLGQLIEASDGDLYGTSQGGGSNNRGVVLKIKKDGTGYSVVLNIVTGAFPLGGVIEGLDGGLYGTTLSGGV